MKKEAYTISVRNPDYANVEGYIHNCGLATRYSKLNRRWKIDHVPTGFGVWPSGFRTRRGAWKAIQKLALVYEWRSGATDVLSLRHITEDVRSICIQYQND